MLNQIIGEVIKSTMNELVQEVVDSQAATGQRDTGESADSLRVTVASTDTTIAGQLYGLERLWIQDRGRGPNKSGKPGRAQIEKLKKWAKRHGMPEEAGYAIATKQAKEGTRVPNEHNPGGLLRNVLNPENVKAKLTPKLKASLRSQFKSMLFEQ